MGDTRFDKCKGVYDKAYSERYSPGEHGAAKEHAIRKVIEYIDATPAHPAGAVPAGVREKIRLAIASVNVHAEASEYEFRADEGDHTPTDAERAMLEDFGDQILSHLEAALISTASSDQED